MACTKPFPVLFADDTNLVVSDKDFNILIETFIEELSSIAEWFQLNRLTLNIKKCNLMIFSNINKYLIELAKMFTNHTQLKLVQHTNFLGVIVDSGLKWSEHIDLVTKRFAKMVGVSRKVCPLIHSSAYLTWNYSFLFLFVNYRCIVWAEIYPSYLKKLSVWQKKYVIYVTLKQIRTFGTPI